MNSRKSVPVFRRQDSHKKGRIKRRWRAARGLQSKVRLALNGYLKVPKTGYGADLSTKGKTKEGLIIVEVTRKEELAQIKKGEGVIIKNIGLKKKVEIVKEAIKLKIILLNVKDPLDFIKKVEDEIKQKKEAKKKKTAKKEVSKTEAKKKAVEKVKEESKEKEKTEEELKEDKKAKELEKNKILTSKNQ